MTVPVPVSRPPVEENPKPFSRDWLAMFQDWFNRLRGISTGVVVISGSGSPEGAVTAGIGALYMRTDGGASTTLYVKESGTGNTGWVAK